MRRLVLAAVVLLALVTAVAALAWGETGWRSALPLGLLAAALQLQAVRLARRVPESERAFEPHAKAWVQGIGLRFLGIVIFGATAGGLVQWFAPLPAALGFLGVLVPLLMMELRIAR